MMTSDFIVTISVDSSKCTGCGTCIEQCPMGVYELVPVGRKKLSRVAYKDRCIACHTCELRCPYEAIVVLPPLGDELKDP
jgi:NAD-dependent dihydropyrimidine dehydrogenase PreA subunit